MGTVDGGAGTLRECVATRIDVSKQPLYELNNVMRNPLPLYPMLIVASMQCFEPFELSRPSFAVSGWELSGVIPAIMSDRLMLLRPGTT